MGRLCLVGLLSLCLCPAAWADDDQGDAARLRGEWLVVEGTQAGRVLARNDLRRWRVVFHDPQENLGGQFVELPGALCPDGVRLYFGALGGPPLRGAFGYRLSAKGPIRRILLCEAPPPGLANHAPWYAGIYELGRDRLKLCLDLSLRGGPDSPARVAWPERFEAPKGSRFALLTLERANAAK
jgi:hypothetical protein